MYHVDNDIFDMSPEYSTFRNDEQSRISHVTPSPHAPEMLTVSDSGLLTLWDAECTQVVHTYEGASGGGGSSSVSVSGSGSGGAQTTLLAEYTGHPKCVWCVQHKSQRVLLFDMRSSTKEGKFQCIASGSRALEGMSGTRQTITALHRNDTLPNHCWVGAENRVLLFDTRFTSVPIYLWHHNHMGCVHALHSTGTPHSTIIATSYDRCTSTCAVYHPASGEMCGSNTVHSVSSTFDPPRIIEHWRRVDTNMVVPIRLVGVDVFSKDDIVKDEHSDDDYSEDFYSEDDFGSDANIDATSAMSSSKGTFFVSYMTMAGDVGMRAVDWSNNPEITVDVVRQKRACGDTHATDLDSGNTTQIQINSTKRKRTIVSPAFDVELMEASPAQVKPKIPSTFDLRTNGPQTMEDFGLKAYKDIVSSVNDTAGAQSSSLSPSNVVNKHVIPGNFVRPRASRQTLFEDTRRIEVTLNSTALFGSAISRIPTTYKEALPSSSARHVVSVNNWEYRRTTHAADHGDGSSGSDSSDASDASDASSDASSAASSDASSDASGRNWLNDGAQLSSITTSTMKRNW